MSNLDFFQAPAEGARLTPPPRSAAPARSRRRSALLIAGFLGAGASLVAILVVLRPNPRDDRPVVLPDTLAGLTPAETGQQLGQSVDLRTRWRKTFGDHPLDTRAYGDIRPGPLVNLVVVRTDSRGKGDLRMGHTPYTKFGDVSCTQTFQMSDSPDIGQGHPKPFRDDRMLLCWRVRTTLTVSVLVLTSPPGYEQTAAKAVEEVWAIEQ